MVEAELFKSKNQFRKLNLDSDIKNENSSANLTTWIFLLIYIYICVYTPHYNDDEM